MEGRRRRSGLEPATLRPHSHSTDSTDPERRRWNSAPLTNFDADGQVSPNVSSDEIYFLFRLDGEHDDTSSERDSRSRSLEDEADSSELICKTLFESHLTLAETERVVVFILFTRGPKGRLWSFPVCLSLFLCGDHQEAVCPNFL